MTLPEVLRIGLGAGNDSARVVMNSLNDTDAIFDGGDGSDSHNAEYVLWGYHPIWWWWRNIRFQNFEAD